MISAVALSFLSLYPWNLGFSGNFTYGEYSTNLFYRAEKAMLSLDRRGKDAFFLSYEHLNISYGDRETTYNQDNLLFRNALWIRPEFRLGSIAGVVQSNSTDKGWLVGGQFEGDLPLFGYSLDYTYLDFEGNDPLGWQGDIIRYPITQWGIGIALPMEFIVFRSRAAVQVLRDSTYLLISGKTSFNAGKGLIVTLYGSFGESRYAFDPYLFVLDNNPDILKQSYGIYASYQVTPNISVSGEALRKEYSPAFDLQWSTTYHVKYFVFGIQLRL